MKTPSTPDPDPPRISAIILLISTLVLVGLGLTMTLSLEAENSHGAFFHPHTLCAGVGSSLLVVMAMTDHRWSPGLAWPAFMIGMFLLLLVYVPGIGQSMNGARRWLRLGTCSIQPSEVAKLVTVVMVAAWFSPRQATERFRWLVPFLLIMIVVALIFCEVDFAAAWIVGAVGLRLMVRGRVSWKVMSVLYALPLLTVATLIWISEHGAARLNDKMLRALGLASNIHPPPAVALASSGWTGRGLGQGSRFPDYYLGNDQDYLLVRIGGSLGWLGLICTVTLLIALMLCGRNIARRAVDRFGMLLGYGLVGLIEWQVIWHVGANLGFLSQSTPLPFMSYSGTNLCVMLTAVGMLLSIDRTERREGASTVTLPCRGCDPMRRGEG